MDKFLQSMGFAETSKTAHSETSTSYNLEREQKIVPAKPGSWWQFGLGGTEEYTKWSDPHDLRIYTALGKAMMKPNSADDAPINSVCDGKVIATAIHKDAKVPDDHKLTQSELELIETAMDDTNAGKEKTDWSIAELEDPLPSGSSTWSTDLAEDRRQGAVNLIVKEMQDQDPKVRGGVDADEMSAFAEAMYNNQMHSSLVKSDERYEPDIFSTGWGSDPKTKDMDTLWYAMSTEKMDDPKKLGTLVEILHDYDKSGDGDTSKGDWTADDIIKMYSSIDTSTKTSHGMFKELMAEHSDQTDFTFDSVSDLLR